MSDPIYRTEAQIEFLELLGKAESAGLKPADVARMLHLSKASISKISQAKQNPRPHTLQALRSLVEDLGGENYEDLKLREETLQYAEKIFKLPETKRELAKDLINQLSADAADAPTSSKSDPKKVPQIAAQSGVEQVTTYSRKKRRAGKSNGNKSTSVPRSRQGKGPQSHQPGQDPKQQTS